MMDMQRRVGALLVALTGLVVACGEQALRLAVGIAIFALYNANGREIIRVWGAGKYDPGTDDGA